MQSTDCKVWVILKLPDFRGILRRKKGTSFSWRRTKFKTASTLGPCTKAEAARALGWEAGVRRDRPQLALCFQTKRFQTTEHPFCPTPCLSAHTQVRPQPPSFLSPPASLALTLPCPQLQGPLSRLYSLPPTRARDTLSQRPAPGYSSNPGSEHTA